MQSALTAALVAMREPISLSHAADDTGQAFDAPCADAARTAERLEEAHDLARALDRLPDDEWEVVRLRHGLGDDRPLTLRQVSSRLGIPFRTVHARELRALGRLKDSMCVQ